MSEETQETQGNGQGLSIQSAAQAGVTEALDLVDHMADTAIRSIGAGAAIGTNTVSAVVNITQFTGQNVLDAASGSAQVILREVDEETQQLVEAIQAWRTNTKEKLSGVLTSAVQVLPGN